MNLKKKSVGKPSERRTPLAQLRTMLTITITKQGRELKKQGGKRKLITQQKTLPVSTVAGWLGFSEHHVRAIERNRPGYHLSQKNAALISRQTGACKYWLLGERKSEFPISWSGCRVTQTDFERAQSDVNGMSWPVIAAQNGLADGISGVATILLHALQGGDIDLYTGKINAALKDILDNLPTKPAVLFDDCIDRSNFHPLYGFKFEPLLNKWKDELLQVYGATGSAVRKLEKAKPRR